jgi:hypothetical protein
MQLMLRLQPVDQHIGPAAANERALPSVSFQTVTFCSNAPAGPYSAGKELDVNLLDHIVIGTNRFVSLKERGLAFG